MTTKVKITKAAVATHVAQISATAERTLRELVFGMWNPEFCSDEGSDAALGMIEEIQDQLAHLKKLCRRDR